MAQNDPGARYFAIIKKMGMIENHEHLDNLMRLVNDMMTYIGDDHKLSAYNAICFNIRDLPELGQKDRQILMNIINDAYYVGDAQALENIINYGTSYFDKVREYFDVSDMATRNMLMVLYGRIITRLFDLDVNASNSSIELLICLMLQEQDKELINEIMGIINPMLDDVKQSAIDTDSCVQDAIEYKSYDRDYQIHLLALRFYSYILTSIKDDRIKGIINSFDLDQQKKDNLVTLFVDVIIANSTQ